MYRRLCLIGLISFLFLISCNNSYGSDSQGGGDYPKVKEITLDVLHTEEGKKVLLDLFSESEFQQRMISTKGDLEQILAKSIADNKTQKDWQKILSEEKVAANIFKATEANQKQLLKTLMKDPEYQKMILDILKDPQFSAHLVQLMKSPTYRQEAAKIMEEALQTPSFQEKIKKMIQQTGTKSQEENHDGSEGQQSDDEKTQ